MKYVLSSLLLFSFFCAQISDAKPALPIMSEDQIPADLQPRLLGYLWTFCSLDKKDNYFQFLQRMSFYHGQKGLGDLELVQKISMAGIEKYKLENKASCIDLGVGLLEAGIIDGKSKSVKIDFTSYRYRTAALRSIAGNIDKPELRAMAYYQNNNV